MSAYTNIIAEMNAANQAFRERIETLQRTCRHRMLTDWLNGYDVDYRMCRRCHKYVMSRPAKTPWPCVLEEGGWRTLGEEAKGEKP